HAALANGMMGHADETDDSHLGGRFHPGCGIVPAALAVAEREGRSGTDFLRAVALGYDIGARVTMALGYARPNTARHST
ncbi:MmgE/PrpD family protein, partial [Klebsiella pneumoniae]